MKHAKKQTKFLKLCGRVEGSPVGENSCLKLMPRNPRKERSNS